MFTFPEMLGGRTCLQTFGRGAACAISVVAAAGACAGGLAVDANAALNTFNWRSCNDKQFASWEDTDSAELEGFQCSTFVRPLDRSKPSSKRVQLAAVKMPATGTPAQRKGTLFLNPGGPGQSGVELSELVYLLPPDVRAAFDFVSYDPRGIGASTPAIQGRGCNIPKPTRPATGSVDWHSVLADRQQQVDRLNAQCYKGNSSIVENAGTVDGTYDLEAMRKAVGDPKITFWGISYGTLLGSTYAQLFPNKVRALVFDGSMDPQISLYGISSGSVAPDHSIGFFLQANPALRPQYDAVINWLNRRTLKLPSNQTYTRWDVLDVLNDDVPFFANPGSDWAAATQTIQTAYAAIFGSGTAKQTALRSLATNSNLQSPSTGTVGSLWSAVVCQDFSDRISNSRQQRRLDWITREGPVYGGSLGVDYLTTCNGYNKAKPHPVPRPKAYGPDVPVVVAAATRDGETPYNWSLNMARTYKESRMVTLVGGIHGIFGDGESRCVNEPIGAFLVSTTLPTIDLTCPYSPPITLP